MIRIPIRVEFSTGYQKAAGIDNVLKAVALGSPVPVFFSALLKLSLFLAARSS